MKVSNLTRMIFALALGSAFSGVSAQGDGNGNGNANGQGNGNNNRPQITSDECLERYNQGICQKMARIEEAFAQDGIVDVDQFNSMKELMKEARPVNPNEKNFKDVAMNVLDRNKGMNKDANELLLEISGELDSDEMRDRIISDIDAGFSDLEDGVPMDPYAGRWEHSAGGGRRRLGVPIKNEIINGVEIAGDRWPNKIVKYYVVKENGGVNNWWNNIFPEMNKLEELTGMDFQWKGYLETESQATQPGFLYVLRPNAAVCSAHIGVSSYFPSKMNIGPGCESPGVILHELGHVVGMEHQHSACYRNNYVSVYLQNAKQKYHKDLKELPCTHGYEYLYDYGSIMHYGEYSASIYQNQKSIDCHGHSCGQSTKLSIYDQWEIIWFNDQQNNYYVVNNGLHTPP